MKYSKTIVCFANSRKTAGRCIAGKEWQNGKAGEWVRPISARPKQEISKKERSYEDGQDPQLLDILTIPCEIYQPLPHQQENHLIDPEIYWTKQGGLSWEDIMECLDNPNSLWEAGERSYAGLNNRIAMGKEEGMSLYLISVEHLRLLVGCKAPEYSDKRAILGEFVYRQVSYRMDVTDPFIERDYLCQADGQYDIHHPVLCISLGELYQGYFYKLIAAVLYPERFK